jgi:hypothetical protein
MKILKPSEYIQQHGQDSYQELLQTHPAVLATQNPNVFQRIGNTFKQAGSNIADQYQQAISSGKPSLLAGIEGGTKIATTAFNTPLQIAMDVLPPKVNEAITRGTSNLVNWFANNAGKNPFDILGGKSPGAIIDNPRYQKFAESGSGQKTTSGLDVVNNLGQISGDILAADQLAKSTQGIVDNITTGASGVNDLASQAYDKAAGNLPGGKVLNDTEILDKYNRAIRPTVAGKTSAGQVAKANTKTLSAIKAIGENKGNLTLTDPNGEILQGQLPKSVDQFSQAISQTKSTIFKQYHDLAVQAGETGVNIDPTSIASELQPVIDSQALKIANPSAVEYATNLQERLLKAGTLDVTTVEDLVKHYNDALDAFYKNPNYNTASAASIDAMVANKFRGLLDQTIEGATGSQYQALKDAYGALSSIEKDVAHRNIVWGRQNAVGLASNLANLGSGAELVRGLIKLNPADLAASATIKGLQKYIQYLNNPDVGVSKIFSSLEKSNPASTVGNIPTAGTGTGGSSSSKFTTKPIPVPQVPDTATPRTIPQEDLNTMSDFTDYVAKSYKPSAKAAQQLELDASRIAERYGIKIGKTNKSISNAFGKVLDKQGFAKTK